MLKSKFYLKLSMFGVIIMMLSVIYGISPQQAQADPNISPMFQDDMITMPSSYELSEEGVPSKCPDPAIFKSGTRTVHTYAPGYATKDIAVLASFYELDADGNLVSDEPWGVSQGIVKTGQFVFSSVKYQANAVGNVGVVMSTQNDDGTWVNFAVGIYRLASSTEKVPEPGQCPAAQ